MRVISETKRGRQVQRIFTIRRQYSCSLLCGQPPMRDSYLVHTPCYCENIFVSSRFPITSTRQRRPVARSNIYSSKSTNRQKTGAISIIRTAYIIFSLKSHPLHLSYPSRCCWEGSVDIAKFPQIRSIPMQQAPQALGPPASRIDSSGVRQVSFVSFGAYFTTFSSSTHQLLSPVPGAFWICLSHSIEREDRSAHGFITFQRGIQSSLHSKCSFQVQFGFHGPYMQHMEDLGNPN